ncbi:MAG TPA: C40 family peptidase [Flavisolibacter sp.]|nr:C40 family peptidase [Flavisolibacter sp.]
MEYAVCTVAAAPVRKEDSHRSEMVNQLLFGETMELLEEKGEWFRIRSLYDDYEGWLTHHLVQPLEKQQAQAPLSFVATGLVNPVQMNSGLVNIPLGASLTGFDAKSKMLWDGRSVYEGAYRDLSGTVDAGLLAGTALQWLNAPYLWGGKTFMGVDCSGFVQTVFKVLGIKLCRDAWQQAGQGRAVELAEAAEGDLAFFKNEQGRIIHVGMMLNRQEIIHAAGKVRIDTLDEEGITSRETGKRTHVFTCLRRVLQQGAQ